MSWFGWFGTKKTGVRLVKFYITCAFQCLINIYNKITNKAISEKIISKYYFVNIKKPFATRESSGQRFSW